MERALDMKSEDWSSNLASHLLRDFTSGWTSLSLSVLIYKLEGIWYYKVKGELNEKPLVGSVCYNRHSSRLIVTHGSEAEVLRDLVYQSFFLWLLFSYMSLALFIVCFGNDKLILKIKFKWN
jgi:hypothetical protein